MKTNPGALENVLIVCEGFPSVEVDYKVIGQLHSARALRGSSDSRSAVLS
jgi:hypothetical protein